MRVFFSSCIYYTIQYFSAAFFPLSQNLSSGFSCGALSLLGSRLSLKLRHYALHCRRNVYWFYVSRFRTVCRMMLVLRGAEVCSKLLLKFILQVVFQVSLLAWFMDDYIF